MALVVALFCVACGPRWIVVTQATPSPFANQRMFAVEPMHYEGLVVGDKSEAEWLAGKDDEQQASWEADKQAFAARFSQELAGALPEVQFATAMPGAVGPFIVRPIVTFFEPGFFAYVVNNDTSVRLDLQLLSPQGQVLDVVRFETVVYATMTNPSTGGRLRTAGDALGNQVGDYIRTRVFPQ
jgi:hypothetical protein